MWTISISHIYDADMDWEFFMIYMLWYSIIESRIWEWWRYMDVWWITVWSCRTRLQDGWGWWFGKYTFTINWQVICYKDMSCMSKCILSFVYLNELFIESFKTYELCIVYNLYFVGCVICCWSQWGVEWVRMSWRMYDVLFWTLLWVL